MFDQILPSTLQPTAPQLPPELAALLPGGPITDTLLQRMRGLATPNAPAFTPPPLGADSGGDPNAGAGMVGAPLTPRPITPTPSALASVLPDPTQAGLYAASQSMDNLPTVNSFAGNVALALGRALPAGVNAFRVQKRANAEATQAATLQAHDYQMHRDFINSADAAKMFGSQIGAARALSDAELGPFLVKNAIVQPVEFSQNTQGDTVQVKGPGATGQPVYRGQARTVNPGQAVPRTSMVNGVQTPVRDANGVQVYDTPNPLPTPKPAALTAAALEDRDIRAIAGMDANDPITADNRQAYIDATKTYRTMNKRAPAAGRAAPLGRIVQTDRGIVSVDPVTHQVTQLTDENNQPIRAPKSAGMVKAQADSAIVAKVTGAGAAPPPSDNTARDAARTTTAKAILNGTQPGDKAVAQAWLKQHPE